MAGLTVPDPTVRESFLAAMAEFHAEGRGDPGDETMIGKEIRARRARWESPDGFAAYVRDLRAEALAETPRRDGWVPCTTLWWTEEREYLGRIAIRHWLTPVLAEIGGHIGYDVRPTARRRGHATAMLRAALPVAAGLGIDRALVTCDPDNLASRKVIEHNGGVPAERLGDKLRYWISTGRQSADA